MYIRKCDKCGGDIFHIIITNDGKVYAGCAEHGCNHVALIWVGNDG